MAKQHAMQTILETGSVPVSKGEASTTMVQSLVPGWQAKGAALATTVINECKGQASNWGRYVADLQALEREGRLEFRRVLKLEVTRPKGVEYDDVAKIAQRSARTRLSEFETIARAIDAGLELVKGVAFHVAVGQSRMFLRSESKGSTRGRKATPDIAKMAKYIAANAPKVGGLEIVLELVQEMIEHPTPDETEAK